jgi:serine/threonine-protein kinase
MKASACAVVVACLVSLGADPARADTSKDQCIDANARGQLLRHDGRLSAARTLLRACASASCPAMVRDDCARRLDELEKAQPSVVFEVKDGGGGDVIDVRVSMDGELLAEHLDGTPLLVEPGVHVFSFEVAGRPTVTEKLLVREGEAGRREHVSVAASPPAVLAPPAPPTARATQPPPSTAAVAAAPARGLGTQRTIGLGVGAAGVVGLGAGAVFGALASSAWGNAKTTCGGSTSACVDPTNGATYRATALTEGTIATVGLVAGGGLLAAGAVLFFTGHAEDAPRRVSLIPTLAPGQAGLSVIGGF